MKKTTVTDNVITEKILDNKLEIWTKQIVQSMSDLFYKKFEANDNRWDENDKKIDKILVIQDKILGKLENWETENTVGTEQIRELRVDVDNHEIRLKSLENAKN